MEKECTEREGISDMIDVMLIIILRSVGSDSNGGEESNDCLEDVPFEWKIHVSDLWKFKTLSFTVVYIAS